MWRRKKQFNQLKIYFLLNMKKDRCQLSTWDFKRVLAALHNSENISPLWDFQAGIIHPASQSN